MYDLRVSCAPSVRAELEAASVGRLGAGGRRDRRPCVSSARGRRSTDGGRPGHAASAEEAPRPALRLPARAVILDFSSVSL